MNTDKQSERSWFRGVVIALPVILVLGVFVTGTGLFKSTFGISVDDQGHRESAEARAGQITTMVTRFNQFLPGGAEPIELVDGAIYTPADLMPLVPAGYCADSDLCNMQEGANWKWNGLTRKFETSFDAVSTAKRPGTRNAH